MHTQGMKMSILKTVINYIKTHIKTTILMIVFVCVFYFALSNVEGVFVSSAKHVFDREAEKRGTYHFIWYNIDDIHESRCRKDDHLTLGFIDVYGTYKVSGKDIHISTGYADEYSRISGGIRITEGDWPVKDDELVLEEELCADLGLSPGDMVVLESEDGDSFKYKLSGLINSYTQYLPATAGFNGKVMCPNALLSTQKDEYVYRNVYMTYDYDFDPLLDYSGEQKEKWFIRNYGEYYDDEGRQENHLYNSIFTKLMFDNLRRGSILRTVAFLSFILAIHVLLREYLSDFKELAANLYRLGSDNRYVLTVLFMLVAVMVLSGIIFGILISVITAPIVTALTEGSISLKQDMIWGLYMILATLLVSAVYAYRHKLYTERMLYATKKIRKTRNISRGFSVKKLALYNVGRNLVRFIVLSIIVALIVTVNVRYDYRTATTSEYFETDKQWIDISQNIGDTSYPEDEGIGITIKDMADIKYMPGIESVDNKEYARYLNGYTVLQEGNSRYEDFILRNEKNKKVFGDEKDGKYLVSLKWSSYLYLEIIGDSKMEYISVAYPDIQKQLDLGNAVVFCPKLRNYESQTLMEDDLYDPENSFSKTKVMDILMGEENESGNTFAIEKVIKDHYVNQYGREMDNVVVIISEEMASECHAFSGVTSSRVYIDNEASDEQITGIKRKILSLTGDHPGCETVYSEDVAYSLKLVRSAALTTEIFVFLMVTIIAIYFIVSFINMQHIQSRKMYGILRSSGMTNSELDIMSVTEVLCSTGILMMITVILSLGGIWLFRSGSMFYVESLFEDMVMKRYSIYSVLFSAVMSLLAGVVSCILLKGMNRRFFSESISSMIRYKE